MTDNTSTATPPTESPGHNPSAPDGDFATTQGQQPPAESIPDHVKNNFGTVLGPLLEREVFRRGLVNKTVPELYTAFQAAQEDLFFNLQRQLGHQLLTSSIDEVLYTILCYGHGSNTESVIQKMHKVFEPGQLFCCLLDPQLCQTCVSEALYGKLVSALPKSGASSPGGKTPGSPHSVRTPSRSQDGGSTPKTPNAPPPTPMHPYGKPSRESTTPLSPGAPMNMGTPQHSTGSAGGRSPAAGTRAGFATAAPRGQSASNQGGPPVPLDANEGDLKLNIQERDRPPSSDYQDRHTPLSGAPSSDWVEEPKQPPQDVLSQEDREQLLKDFLDEVSLPQLFSALKMYSIKELMRWPRDHFDETLKVRVCSRSMRTTLFEALHPNGENPPPMTPPPQVPAPKSARGYDDRAGYNNGVGDSPQVRVGGRRSDSYQDPNEYNRYGEGSQGASILQQLQRGSQSSAREPSTASNSGMIPAPRSAQTGAPAPPAPTSQPQASPSGSPNQQQQQQRRGQHPRGILCLTGCKRFDIQTILDAVRFYADIIEADYDKVPVTGNGRRGQKAAQVPDTDTVIARIGNFQRGLLQLYELPLWNGKNAPKVNIEELVLLDNSGQPLPKSQQPRAHHKSSRHEDSTDYSTSGNSRDSRRGGSKSEEGGRDSNRNQREPRESSRRGDGRSEPREPAENSRRRGDRETSRSGDHHRDDDANGERQQRRQRDTENSQSGDGRSSRSNVVCRFFQTSGGCNRGADCKFLHSKQRGGNSSNNNSFAEASSSVTSTSRDGGRREPREPREPRERRSQRERSTSNSEATTQGGNASITSLANASIASAPEEKPASEKRVPTPKTEAAAAPSQGEAAEKKREKTSPLQPAISIPPRGSPNAEAPTPGVSSIPQPKLEDQAPKKSEPAPASQPAAPASQPAPATQPAPPAQPAAPASQPAPSQQPASTPSESAGAADN